MQKQSGQLGWWGRPASQSELVKLRQEDPEFKDSQAMQEESMVVGAGRRGGRKEGEAEDGQERGSQQAKSLSQIWKGTWGDGPWERH